MNKYSSDLLQEATHAESKAKLMAEKSKGDANKLVKDDETSRVNIVNDIQALKSRSRKYGTRGIQRKLRRIQKWS